MVSKSLFIYFFLILKTTPKVLELPTLGHQPVVLGGFYSSIHSEFLPAMTLWSGSDVEKHKATIHHPVQRTEWTSSQTMSEKLNMLGRPLKKSINQK